MGTIFSQRGALVAGAGCGLLSGFVTFRS
jgi:hypothetical protein